ncbi:hypothetical protein B0H12DRAFT_1096843 [Mycena haematopus]|nr:hypothetical protein B0H12DRAFT_1096843 [Mycena haematopus]
MNDSRAHEMNPGGRFMFTAAHIEKCAAVASVLAKWRQQIRIYDCGDARLYPSSNNLPWPQTLLRPFWICCADGAVDHGRLVSAVTIVEASLARLSTRGTRTRIMVWRRRMRRLVDYQRIGAVDVRHKTIPIFKTARSFNLNSVSGAEKQRNCRL